ncbi:uncharacterized protein RJT20DRAFT_134228 [Scheffersomyces xylosifermentans]|uniref:uncharacterized protein n=1 Tax=Scheffersomyces xylosifermentans TaxID=1304137 RepID=UPI00315D1483
MTKLVLEPTQISHIFPNASVSRTYRVRIIAQVVEYNPHEPSLVLCKLPNIPDPDVIEVLDDDEEEEVSSKNGLKVKIDSVIQQLNPSVIEPGSTVDAEGMYDGSVVDIFMCCPIPLLTQEQMEVLVKMTKLHDFK